MDDETLDQYLDYVYARELEDVLEALAGIEADLRSPCCRHCGYVQALRMDRKALRKRRDRLMRHL